MNTFSSKNRQYGRVLGRDFKVDLEILAICDPSQNVQFLTDLLELWAEAGERLEALVDLEGGRVLAEELGQLRLQLAQGDHLLLQVLQAASGILCKRDFISLQSLSDIATITLWQYIGYCDYFPQFPKPISALLP